MIEQELPQECCAKCRFRGDEQGEGISEVDKEYHCRRYPPMQFVHEYDEPPGESLEHVDAMTGALECYSFWFFPVVLATQWCGEFQPSQPNPA